MNDFATHGNALLIASVLLETIVENSEIFQVTAQYHEIPAAEMEEIRAAIRGPIARLLRDMGEQHRILAELQKRPRGML